jgi:hypothetical protein
VYFGKMMIVIGKVILVVIGDQIWMAENLRTKQYWDGSEIEYYDTNGDADKANLHPDDAVSVRLIKIAAE